VKAFANPWLAASMQWMHPMRVKTYVWSERFLPMMGVFGILADAVAKTRQPLPDGHPLVAQERQLVGQISAFWEVARRLRDATQERAFKAVYGE
jgi:hypothetical protein